MLAVGTLIAAGKYRVDRVIGRGGMGMVVGATHLQLQQQVALKFLLPDLVKSHEVVERFVREARASGQLRGEHVCRVWDVGTFDDGAPYIVMELLEGRDLASLLESNGPLAVQVATDYVLQACIGVAEAHALEIVHRDLKPANLFLARRPDGTPLIKVLDFGIAKAKSDRNFSLTQTSTMLGSPSYMSPEQLRSSRDADTRSDIWSIGVILYELVSGRRPFHGDSLIELASQIAIHPPAPLIGRIPPGFELVVQRCLAKVPAQRYPDVADLAQALAPYAGPAGQEMANAVSRLLSRAPRASLDGGTYAQLAHVAVDHAQIATTQPNISAGANVSTPTTMGSAASSMATAPSGGKRRRVIAGVAVTALLGAVVTLVMARGTGVTVTSTSTPDTATVTAANPPADAAAPMNAALPPASPVSSVSPLPSVSPVPSMSRDAGTDAGSGAASNASKPAKAQPKPRSRPIQDNLKPQNRRTSVRVGISRFSGVVVLIVLALTTAAGAQPSAPPSVRSAQSAAADAEFAKGRALMKQHKYDEASNAFEQSQELDPGWVTLVYLAECYEHTGKLASAQAMYRELAQPDTYPAPPGVVKPAEDRRRRKETGRRASALEKRSPKLRLTSISSPAGLVVTLDGVDVTSLLGTDQPVDIRTYKIHASAPNHKDFESTTAISDEAKTVVVAIELAPADEPSHGDDKLDGSSTAVDAGSTTPVPDTTKPKLGVHKVELARPVGPETTPQSRRGTYGVIVAAGGGAVVVTGLVFGWLASSKWSAAKNQCGGGTICPNADTLNDTLVRDARAQATISTALVIGGAAAIGVGAVLFVTAPSRGAHATSTALRITPSASADAVSLTLDGRF